MNRFSMRRRLGSRHEAVGEATEKAADAPAPVVASAAKSPPVKKSPSAAKSPRAAKAPAVRKTKK